MTVGRRKAIRRWNSCNSSCSRVRLMPWKRAAVGWIVTPDMPISSP